MNRRVFGACLVITTAMIGGGCSRPPLTGPPDVRLGREECAECGMLVNEDRCSSASLVERDGERVYAHFDDIGCMLDYEYEHAGAVVIRERYVHDHASRAWMPAAEGVYLFADHQKLRTPMGSGIAPFKTRDEAERLRQDVGGELMDLHGVALARRDWMWSRFGKPEGARPVESP